MRNDVFDGIFYGIPGHWFKYPKSMAAMEAPIWLDESMFLRHWAKNETAQPNLIPYIDALRLTVDTRVDQIVRDAR